MNGGTAQRARMDDHVATALHQAEWAKAGAAMALNALHIALLESHQKRMADSFARIDALLKGNTP